MLYGCFTVLGQFYDNVSASAMTLKDMDKIAMDPVALSHGHIYTVWNDQQQISVDSSNEVCMDFIWIMYVSHIELSWRS